MLDEALIGREFVHFKGGHYRLEGYARHSETREDMVVYRALYGEGGLWVRPAKMFFEHVDKPGYSGPRTALQSHWDGGRVRVQAGMEWEELMALEIERKFLVDVPTEDTPFAKPIWVSVDVTDDHRYKNNNLAKRPYSTWGMAE